MKTKVGVVLVLATLLFAIYLYFFGKPEGFAIETPAPAPPMEQPPPHLPERIIAPAGPNSPSQQADLEEPPVRLPGPKDMDPFAESYRESNFGDDNRAPEKLFGPAPLPTVTDVARESGVASGVLSPYQPSVEQFNPENAQNGGEFIRGGVFAFDKDEQVNYSQF
jgi:hypothetical protein